MANAPKPLSIPSTGTPADPSQGETPYVTMQMLARRLNCGVATVSMALRDNPKIRSATRARVKALAAEMGYRPDPELSRLMHALRTHRTKSYQSTLYALSEHTEGRQIPHPIAEMIEGCRMRAGQLGYRLVVEDISRHSPDLHGHDWELQKKLLNRGVEGLLLLPLPGMPDLDDRLDWSKFSVVSLHPGMGSPSMDTVEPHSWYNMRLALDQLLHLGHCRLGVVIDERQNRMTDEMLTATVSGRFCRSDRAARISVFLSSFPAQAHGFQGYGARPVFDLSGLHKWYATIRPDALVITGDALGAFVTEHLRLTASGPVRVAIVGRRAQSPFAGVTERSHEIGATGVDLLDRKIKSGAKGPSPAPTAMMLKGRWELPLP